MQSLLKNFRPKCAERCLRFVRSSVLPQDIFRIDGFHAKNSTNSTSVGFSIDQNIYHTDVW